MTTIRCLALGLSVLVLVSCKPEGDAAAVDEVPSAGRLSHKIPDRVTISAPPSGVELGMGWDSRRGEIVPNHCLDFSPIKASGQEVTMDMREVSDHSEVMDSLNISAAVKVKSIVGSADAKASFAKSTKITSNSTTLLLTAKVDNGVLFMGPPAAPGQTRYAFPTPREQAFLMFPNSDGRQSSRLSNYASPEVSFKPFVRAKVKSPAKFREHCGDYYVAAIFSGAELLATINYTAKSQSEAQKISASVKAKYGKISAKVDADKTKATASESTDLNISFVQIGGGGGIIPIGREGLLEKLRQLPTEAAVSPKFHSVELRSYREVPESDGLVFSSADDEFETITDYYWMLTSVQDDLNHILEKSGEYEEKAGRTAEDYENLQDEILTIRRALFEITNAYYGNRLPDAALLDKVDHNWFPAAPDEKFRLNLPDIKESEPANSLTACGPSNWFDCVIKELKEAMPSENPNVVKLLLPLPKFITTVQKNGTDVSAFKDEVEYKKLVLDWYIRPQSERVCAIDPNDNECMTNAEIRALAEFIPYKAT